MLSLDENKKNFMSDPSNKQTTAKLVPIDDQDDQASLEPIKGAASAGAIRCVGRPQKESQDQQCKVCDRPLVLEQDKYKLNYEGSPQTVCFVCYLTALKANPTDSKHREQISGLRTDTLQNLGLQSCSKHPSSHSLSSFTYCATCDLVQCSLCLLASPHRFHQIYPLPAALNTAKKLRDFIVAQIQDQEHTLTENSADKKDGDSKQSETGGLTEVFDKLWAPLAKSLRDKEATIRAELLQMEQSFLEQKVTAQARKDELVSEFKRMKKEFKHLSGLGLLKSTLSLPETSLEKAYQSNRDSFLGKTPSIGYLTPRTGVEPSFQETQEEDTEVVYQRLLKDWRVSSLLGVRSSRLLEEIDAAGHKLSQEYAAKQKVVSKLGLSGLEEVVKAVEALSLNSRQPPSKVPAQSPLHKSRPSLSSKPESTNLGGNGAPPGMFDSAPLERSQVPKTSHFLLDVLELQHTALGKSSGGIRPGSQPSEVPQSCYLSGPKLSSVESPIFLDFKSTPFSRKVGPSFTKFDGQPGDNLAISNLPQPFFHSHHQQAGVLPKPLIAPYNFGRPSMQSLASPLPQSLQTRPPPATTPLAPPDTAPQPSPTLQHGPPQNQPLHKAEPSNPSKDNPKPQPKPPTRPQQSSSPNRGKPPQTGALQVPPTHKTADKTSASNKENKPAEKDAKKDRGRECKPARPPGGK